MNDTFARIQKAIFKLPNTLLFKRQVFQWATEFETVCYLDSNDYPQELENSYDCLVAVGMESELRIDQESGGDPFLQLQNYYESKKDWLFGFLSYDLKNDIEDLKSENKDGLDFPKMHFFQASYILKIKDGWVDIESKKNPPANIFQQISTITFPSKKESIFSAIPQLQARISKAEYLATIRSIREHLHQGDIYEMNFCQEFYAENCEANISQLFQKLNRIAKAPFSAYYQLGVHHLLSSSPERFLKKIGSKLISQPIKGTSKRGETEVEDGRLKKALSESQKDRSENVMIVDLVRNDLAKSCKAGSVKVEELFKIYPFEQVFQMISTISGELHPETHFVEAIKNAFPMGSMTGAPKIRSMKLIEHYEQSRRGLYSGAIGYITPEGDFDFNVVIRSILYNAQHQYLSYQVGGAIVYDSVPENEYEECLLKAKGMLQAMGIKNL